MSLRHRNSTSSTRANNIKRPRTTQEQIQYKHTSTYNSIRTTTSHQTPNSNDIPASVAQVSSFEATGITAATKGNCVSTACCCCCAVITAPSTSRASLSCGSSLYAMQCCKIGRAMMQQDNDSIEFQTTRRETKWQRTR